MCFVVWQPQFTSGSNLSVAVLFHCLGFIAALDSDILDEGSFLTVSAFMQVCCGCEDGHFNASIGPLLWSKLKYVSNDRIDRNENLTGHLWSPDNES